MGGVRGYTWGVAASGEAVAPPARTRDHRTSTAWRAAALRSSGVMAAARALPPERPSRRILIRMIALSFAIYRRIA